MGTPDRFFKPARWLDLLTVALSLLWLMPLVFTVLVSFRPESISVSQPNLFVACSERALATTSAQQAFIFGNCVLTGENYTLAWAVSPWGRHYLNTVIFTLGTLAVQVFTITMAGYAFARMTFLGRDVLLFAVLIQLMIPTGVLIVQNFSTIRQLGLFDTYLALMMPYWGSAFGTLLIRQAFREVPLELEEAARLDGANLFQLLFRVYVPLTIPTYVAFALVSISAHWNEFLWPFIVTRSDDVRPLTVGLNKLLKTTEVGAQYGQLMAGTLFVILPLVILFMLFQRRFIESFMNSGLK
jgi:sn-glycerol 3-phosphate transport system permease protein